MTNPATSRVSSTLAFRISVAAGVVVLLLTVMAIMREQPRPCGPLDSNYAPIIAFELARSRADLEDVFGTAGSPCRPSMIAAMDAINWTDVLVFIPIYGTFLISFFLGQRERSPRLARLGVQIGALAILGDYAENLCLMNLTPALDTGSVWFGLLPWATGLKWLSLGVAAGLGGLIFSQASERRAWHVIAALGCLFAFLVPLAGTLLPHLFGPVLSQAIGLSWALFLIDGVIEVGSRLRKA